MPDVYPLAALLAVRNFREEAAKRDLTKAQSDLVQAKDTAEKKAEELEKWKNWVQEETERRYDSLIGRKTDIEKITQFNQGIADLNARTLDKALDVTKAEEAVKTCEKKVDQAHEMAKTARKNTAKIETHRDIWTEEEKKAAEHAEDLEFEEFTGGGALSMKAED